MNWWHTEEQTVPNMSLIAGQQIPRGQPPPPPISEIFLCQILTPRVSEKLDPPLQIMTRIPYQNRQHIMSLTSQFSPDSSLIGRKAHKST